MTEEDMESTCTRGEGEQECWFEEGGCIELSEMEIAVGVGEIAVRVG